MNIVFVQLGNPPKEFFWENLNYLRRLRPSLEINVISDLEEVINRAERMRFKGFTYATPESLRNLFSNHAYPKEFRNGFWQLSALRLFALLEYCEKNKEQSVLHIESDVLLLPNFPFETIAIQEKLMWFNFNNDRDVASLIWIPSHRQASWMRDGLIEIFSEDPMMTDMSALRKLSLKAPEMVSYFKSNPHHLDGGAEASFAQITGGTIQEAQLEVGIFDGASIGMWLTGEDPNNHRGMLHRLKHLADGPIDLRETKFVMIERNLYLKDRSYLIPIYNLHIHSKNRFLFTKYGSNILRICVLLSNRKIGFPIFLPVTFIRLALNKIRNITI